MLARIYHKLRLPQICGVGHLAIYKCRIPCDNIDAAVSTCLWQKFKLLILLLKTKHSIRVKNLYISLQPMRCSIFLLLTEMSVRITG